jgi:hypothetical protein
MIGNILLRAKTEHPAVLIKRVQPLQISFETDRERFGSVNLDVVRHRNDPKRGAVLRVLVSEAIVTNDLAGSNIAGQPTRGPWNLLFLRTAFQPTQSSSSYYRSNLRP